MARKRGMQYIPYDYEAGGSSSTYTCDYFWWNAGITAVALVGGRCDNGGDCGAACLSLDCSAGSATDAGVEIDAEQTKTLVGCIAFDDISGALEILQEIGITGAMFDELKEIIEEMRKGVPLGYFTSQWFGNFYLKALDHYIKEELHAEHYMEGVVE